MNIKYLFVVSLALLFVAPKKAQAQATDSGLITLGALPDDDFLINHDEDDIFGDNQQVITTDARTLQNAAPTRGIYIDDFLYRWYIQGGIGAQFLMGEDDSKGKLGSRITLAPSLSVGYRFNPVFGIRANFSGGSLHGFNDGHSGTYRFWKGKSEDQKIAIINDWADKGIIDRKHQNGDGSWNQGWLNQIDRWDPQWNYMGLHEGSQPYVTDPNNKGQVWYNDKAGHEGYHWIPGRDDHGNNLYMQHVRYLAFNTALTMNLSNLIGGANDSRKFHFSLYLGPSIFHTFPHQGQVAYTGIGLYGGLEAQYNISDKIGLFSNFNGYAMPDGFDGHMGGDSFDLIGQSVFGLAYKFSTAGYQKGITLPPLPVDDDMNEQLNKIRADLMREMNEMVDLQPEIDRLRQQLAELHRQPEVEQVIPQKESYFLPNAIHFAIGKTDINAEGWNTIEDVAAYMNNNPDATVIITGFADKDTGTGAINERLSQERSKKVADALTYRYNIPKGRVAIDWRGDTLQPFGQNARNRAVLFYIEFD